MQNCQMQKAIAETNKEQIIHFAKASISNLDFSNLWHPFCVICGEKKEKQSSGNERKKKKHN